MKVRAFQFDTETQRVETLDKTIFETYKKLTNVVGTEYDETNPDLNIFLANVSYFNQPDILDFIFEKGLRNPLNLKKSSKLYSGKEESSKTIPILTIYDSTCLGADEYNKIRYGVQYLDSSIWQRWVDINSKTFEAKLKETFEELEIYKGQIIDIDNASVEFSDFETRMFQNAYLIDIKNEGHAKYVNPLPFSSESFFKKKLNEKKDKLPKGLEMSVLYLDDKLLSEKTKQRYLNFILEKHLTKVQFQIDYASNIKEATDLMTENSYDLIFVDYLLGANNNNSRDKGIDFLINLNGDNDLKKGILKKYWIVLASSYPSAFLDDIKQRGMTLNSNDWTIYRGGSPFLTPYNFLFSLISMIETIYEEIIPSDDNTILNIWSTSLKNLEKKETFTRGWANSTLSAILNARSNIEALKNHDSSFAKSFPFNSENKKIANEDKGLFGYLTHLLFMLSFSDGYEWEEMKTNLERIKNLVPEFTASKQDKQTGYEILNKRILKLKETFDGK